MKRMLVGPVLLGAAIIFSACGSTATSSTSSVVNLESTNYHTLPPTPTTVAPTTTLPGATVPGDTTLGGATGGTDYTVVKGDNPSSVAKRFSVTVAQLNAANTDTAGYSSFYIGLKIKLPVGAVVPSTIAPTKTTIDLATSKCVKGTYTIVKGDLPATVAKKFSITKAQLDAINVNTKGYTNFIVGTKILIPATNVKGCP